MAAQKCNVGFVITMIIQAICKITKLSWFDESPNPTPSPSSDKPDNRFVHQDIVDITTNFLKVKFYWIFFEFSDVFLHEMIFVYFFL